MNQENSQNQIQAQQLTPEELQKTQVLNLQELEKTIQYEKKTSKKPAIIVAIIGILSIAIGSSVFTFKTLSSKNDESRIQKKEIVEPQEKEVKETSLTCEMIKLNREDGTDTDLKVIYQFENDKIVSFTKSYTISATNGNEKGIATVEAYKKVYQSFLNPTIGYQITLSPKGTTGMIVNVKVDYEKLDMTTINPTQNTHISTSVEYPKDSSKLNIQTDMISKGLTCK